ncbi:4-hydroxy-tetrahydrodipicolinate synthase [Acididesulfobacillus acetoxydans]|nr:4-hydroxy-tetrahydrodipicolinate synthase [Acididesulfobacillus acetoxydans]
MGFGPILTAMVTPMNQSLEVDYAEAKRLALFLTEHGSDGIVVCGTTGESPTLSAEEKLELFRVVKKAVGTRRTVIAGTGSNSTDASIRLTKLAAETGVDGILAVVPYYNKPSQDGLFRHFRALAQATDLPVMLYNVPGRTSANLLPATVQRLAEIPNIVALKEAAGSTDQMSELKRLLPPDFQIYSGDDSLTLPFLALGGSGVVSVAAHVIGDEMKEMINAWQRGDVKTALQWHLKLYPMFKGIFITTNPVPIKALVNMSGFKAGGLRLPLVDATEGEREYLAKLLKEVKEN